MHANIFITDDHQIFIDGLTMLLEDIDGVRVVGSANNIQDTLNYLGTDTNLLLLDINLNDESSIDHIPAIKERYPNVKIVMLSMHGDFGHVTRSLNEGVDGYILKNTSSAELCNAIEQVMNNQKYFSVEVSQVIAGGVTGDHSSDLDKLSKREIQIIRLIAREKTTAEIADELKLSKYTVDTHRKNIVSKLNAKTAAGITKFAIKHNLID